jgi:hypothetical protein
MKNKSIIVLAIFTAIVFIAQLTTNNEQAYHPAFSEADNHHSIGFGAAYAYPPGVGILSDKKSCVSCHADNGPWGDKSKIVIDILDNETKQSLKQPDGSFLIETNRWAQKTVLTVIGSLKEEAVPVPYRNAWLYIDTTTIGANSLSKFAPGWDVNLPMSCRVVGDKLPGFEHANITSLPMTIQPMTNANDAELQLQVMLTKGESVKGKAKEGILGNYFEQKVRLVVK